MNDDKCHILFRGQWVNRPPIKSVWSKEQCWLEGYHKALKTFKRDLRTGQRRMSDAQQNGFTWSGEKP